MHPKAAPENDQGRVDSSLTLTYVTVVLKPSPAQQADLEQLLAEQQDPSSPNYHHWLTPEEYADRFGVSQGDLNQVTAWLQAQHLTVAAVARGRNWVAFRGAARDVEEAFGTELHRYEVNGALHYANASAPSIPAALDPVVLGIHGLNDIRLQPAIRFAKTLPAGSSRPNYTSGSGNHYLAPDDIAAIYDMQPLYNAGIDGTGQRLVVVGQTQINLSDLEQYRTYFNLPAHDPQVILVPNTTNPGISNSDLVEADLDLELSAAVARNVSVLYVFSADVTDAVQYAIDQNLAPVLSMSYGACEALTPASDASTLQSWASQANAQGITWLAASGDSGAADCVGESSRASYGLAVDLPAAIPQVTGVGGTEFAEGSGSYWNSTNSASRASALSYIPEAVWNDSALVGSPTAGGGGASVNFPKPSWQAGTGVPSDGARDVPDVALAASADHDGYLIFSGGNEVVVGGTSAGAPSFAGITALVNQYTVSKGYQASPGLGNINPRLYGLAQAMPGVFHDVTAGNNIVNACPGKARTCSATQVGFSAGTGYDQATGLGSVDTYNLVTSWNSSSIPTTKPNLTIAMSHAGSFTQGQSGAAYTISVGNSGPGTTQGVVTVTDSMPVGLTATSISGVGWSCTLPAGPCTRSDALSAASSYPTLTVTVNVASNAPSTVTNTAIVTGGGASGANTANDVTTIVSGTLPSGGSDLAIGRSATQSSTYPGFAGASAASAVDGNTNGSFFSGSVTATNFDSTAWWQVDLGGSATIGTVVIWNRTDCCISRLNDYWVFVSNTPFLSSDTPATLQNRAGTFSSHQTVAPNPSVSIATGGTQGRYVRVQLTGTNYLSLAEVQVFGSGVAPISNLVVGKAATQSSTYPGYASAAASSAVDGNTDGNFPDGSVTATNFDSTAWWQVDLGASATVSSITIWNRTDCCATRLGDYWVFVSNTPFLSSDTPSSLQGRAGTFASHQTAAPNPSTSIAVGVQGRYVRVQLTGTNYLSLAEVQVFGQ